MDNITGLNINETFQNLNVSTINQKSIVDEFNEQDEMLIEIIELREKVNLLLLFINEQFNKEFETIT